MDSGMVQHDFVIIYQRLIASMPIGPSSCLLVVHVTSIQTMYADTYIIAYGFPYIIKSVMWRIVFSGKIIYMYVVVCV